MTVWVDVDSDCKNDITAPHINGQIKIKALKLPKNIPAKVIKTI
jgi:hypothetical protein